METYKAMVEGQRSTKLSNLVKGKLYYVKSHSYVGGFRPDFLAQLVEFRRGGKYDQDYIVFAVVNPDLTSSPGLVSREGRAITVYSLPDDILPPDEERDERWAEGDYLDHLPGERNDGASDDEDSDWEFNPPTVQVVVPNEMRQPKDRYYQDPDDSGDEGEFNPPLMDIVVPKHLRKREREEATREPLRKTARLGGKRKKTRNKRRRTSNKRRSVRKRKSVRRR